MSTASPGDEEGETTGHEGADAVTGSAASKDVWSAPAPPKQRMTLPVPPLVAATVVLLLAQVVLTILLLGTVQQLRDQTASSSGFQRCEARAVTGSTDNATYRKAIQDCLSR